MSQAWAAAMKAEAVRQKQHEADAAMMGAD